MSPRKEMAMNGQKGKDRPVKAGGKVKKMRGGGMVKKMRGGGAVKGC